MSCGVGHRSGSDPALLWLWCRPAATALIRPLAWESPHNMGAALKSKKKKTAGRRSRLRIQCCHCSSLGHCCGTGSIPGPGISTCHGHNQVTAQENDEDLRRGYIYLLFRAASEAYGDSQGSNQSCSCQPTPQPQHHKI